MSQTQPEFATADLYDANEDKVRVAVSLFGDFGGRLNFAGRISTVKVHEDNTLVRAALEEPGEGRVLVVDGGESMRCALVGDMLAELGARNGWAGIVVSGCIRDSAVISEIDIGVKALGTNPRKSQKLGTGQHDVSVEFAGVTFIPGEYLYADEDGILVSKEPLF